MFIECETEITIKVNLRFFTMFTSPMQACSGVSEYDTQYYSPASQEEQLYSQLRQEKIKAIEKHQIE